MACRLTRRIWSLLLVAMLASASMTSAQACLWNEPYEAGKPFDEAYFREGDIIFRGHPVAYNYPHPESPYISEGYSDVTFEVVETYLGNSKERWTARWFTIAFPKPKDLNAFKLEIGDDLLVVLSTAQVSRTDDTSRQVIVHGPCQQPAMRSYAVMEPVLRERGLIE